MLRPWPRSLLSGETAGEVLGCLVDCTANSDRGIVSLSRLSSRGCSWLPRMTTRCDDAVAEEICTSAAPDPGGGIQNELKSAGVEFVTSAAFYVKANVPRKPRL